MYVNWEMSIYLFIYLFIRAVSWVEILRVRYTLEQRVFVYDTHVESNFQDVTAPNRTIHRIVNKLKQIVSLLGIKFESKRRMFTEQKFDEIASELESSPRKFLRRLEQEIGILESCARNGTKLLNWMSHRQEECMNCNHVIPLTVNFCVRILQPVDDGEIYPHLIFFCDVAWFHLHVGGKFHITTGTGVQTTRD